MIAEAVAWWLVIQAAGLIALPIALVLFRNLPGRGYAYSKPLGLLLGGFLFWLALSLHLLPNRPGSIVWVFIGLAVVSAWLLKTHWPEIREALEEQIELIIAVEIVFAGVFFTAGHIRSFIPDIAGTEKPMDFMFLNAASRSQYYPPSDPWLSGASVSYYYFGYVIQSMVAKIAAVSTPVAFNLALASTAGLAATAAFGLGADLISMARRASLRLVIGCGLTAALLVTALGNLEGVIEFGVANGNLVPQSVIERIDIDNLDQAQASDACLAGISSACIEYPNEESSFWWWWRATRISPDGGSITEFPFFSFILGDLHPHVMAIPFVLTVVAIGLSFWRSPTALSFDTWRRAPWLLLLTAVLVGGMGFLNTWDLPAFGFVIAMLVVARNLTVPDVPLNGRLRDSAGFFLPLFVLAAILYAPFYLSFSSQASGIDAVRSGATRPLHSALFWTPLLVASLPLPLLLLAGDRPTRTRERMLTVVLLPVALFISWAFAVLVMHGPSELGDAITARGWNWLTSLFYAGALVACILALWRAFERWGDGEDGAVPPVLILMSTAILLVLGSELFYIKDVFGSRLNTVFKLTYQAWLMLGVSGAYSLFWLWSRLELSSAPLLSKRTAWAGVVTLVLAGALLYPLGATLSRTEGLVKPNRTLDGLAYTHNQGEDAAAVVWLKRFAGQDERIVEAVGGQYSAAGRMSAWTGVPTILGWPGHETQWGRDGLDVSERRQDVDYVYETTSLADALTILRKYGVTYVIVGSVERSTYPAAGLQKFETLTRVFPPAIAPGQASIYRVPAELPSSTELTGVTP